MYELKVKAKSLAEEARIIRKEEKKLRDKGLWNRARQKPTNELDINRESLYRHRTFDVREEARATHIARAYLRGRALKEVEGSETPCRFILRAERIAKKYGKDFSSEDFKVWVNA